MALPVDPNPRLAQYAHPERLVTTEWLATNLGSDGLVVAESDEDILLYAIGHIPLIDVRSPAEYTGERTHLPDHPDEGALRGGHIPTAATVPWSRAAAPDGTFKPRAELEQIYLAGAGLSADHEAITYCRIGERSSHTWFVLRFLLGLPTVRNYDGSWTEWGSLVGAPIVKGDQPGSIEAA